MSDKLLNMNVPNKHYTDYDITQGTSNNTKSKTSCSINVAYSPDTSLLSSFVAFFCCFCDPSLVRYPKCVVSADKTRLLVFGSG